MKTYYYREEGSVKDEYIYNRNNGGTDITDTTHVEISDVIIDAAVAPLTTPSSYTLLTKISSISTANGNYTKAKRGIYNLNGGIIKSEISNDAGALNFNTYNPAADYKFKKQEEIKYTNQERINEVTDKNDSKTVITYDAVDRISKITKTKQPNTLENQFIYGTNNSLLNSCTNNADGKWIAENYSYDWVGNVINKKTAFDLTSPTDITSSTISTANIGYEYDPLGFRNKILLPNGEPITTSLNNSGLLKGINSPYGNMQYAYNKDGRLKGYFRGNATTNVLQTHFKYNETDTNDLVGKFTELTNVASPTANTPDVLQTQITGVKSIFSGFNYDGRGRLLSYNAKVDDLTTATERDITFEYDGRGQLKGEKHHLPGDATNVFWANTDYSYDTGTGVNLSNITRTAGTGCNTLPHTPLAFDVDNRITSNGYQFDTTTGNPSIYNGKNMSYDLDDRLIKVDDNTTGTILTCGYYMEGKRAWKKGDSTGNTRTYFLYDGDQLLCEVKYDSTIATNDKYYVTAINLWGADGLAGRTVKTGT